MKWLIILLLVGASCKTPSQSSSGLPQSYELVVVVRDNNMAVPDVVNYCMRIPFATGIDIKEPVWQNNIAHVRMNFHTNEISLIDKIKEELMLITGVLHTQVNKL